jgi:polyhydroxyalkanoate synthesis regulator phasin
MAGKLKSFFFEDTGPDEKPKKTSAKAVDQETLDKASWGELPAMTLEDAHNLYEQLLEKTKFSSTTAGAEIEKYMTTLASVGDPALRLKLAIGQAKAIDKLTDKDIQDAFSTVHDKLAQERAAFDDSMSAFEKHDVTEPSVRVTEIEKQVNDLVAERNRLEEQVAKAKGMLAQAKAQFENAVNRRTAEIGQEEKAVIAALQ